MEQQLLLNVLATAFISAMERHIPKENSGDLIIHPFLTPLSFKESVITFHLTGDLGFTKVRFYPTS